MPNKSEALGQSKRIYEIYLKHRKKPNNEERFEAGFDLGYERGLSAAWYILQENREAVIKSEEVKGWFFRKYNASWAAHKLQDLVMDYKTKYECFEKYKPVDCFCDKCGKSK